MNPSKKNGHWKIINNRKKNKDKAKNLYKEIKKENGPIPFILIKVANLLGIESELEMIKKE